MRTVKEDFRLLLKNNKDQDWNNITFVETMVNAFEYNINRRVERLKAILKKDLEIQLKAENKGQTVKLDFALQLIDEYFPELNTQNQNNENEVKKE